ncbi:MAG: dephospho-CoA kinase [Bryobacteraceae bacterium]|nr:dephospho-CoA kinase [Bryobacteraceae bacterium]
MLRVGLTGGLATGKSFVGAALRDLGCCLIKADDLGHQVLMPDGEAYASVVRAFGPGILNADGFIDRRKLAAEVFDRPERLEALNRLVHPPVRARGRRIAERFLREHPDGIVVNEAAILIETGSYRDVDKLVVAACPEPLQVERAMHRDGITREEAMARIRRQMPIEDKVKLADYVIDTSGTKEHTLEQTREVYRQLRSLPA